MRQRKILPIIGSHSEPWDLCLLTELQRMPAHGSTPERLDRGVNFFVLALEKLGCRTHYSCEGHPGGFYIAFSAEETVARAIHQVGYFTIEICNGLVWRLSLQGNEDGLLRHEGVSWSESAKCNVLRMASKAWVDQLPIGNFWEVAA